MATKQTMTLSFLNDVFQEICDFAINEATPSKYCKEEQPEESMQIHFGKFMSQWYDVLREVEIPALCKLTGSGEDRWEIDESLQFPAIDKRMFYAAGELKFHGKEMKDRDFVAEAKEDIRRMLCVAPYFFDTTMTFTLFISCDKQEIDDVHKYAKQQVKIKNIKVLDAPEGYFAIAIQIIPDSQEDSHAPFYGVHWKERYDYLVSTKQLKNNYFPKRVRLFL